MEEMTCDIYGSGTAGLLSSSVYAPSNFRKQLNLPKWSGNGRNGT